MKINIQNKKIIVTTTAGFLLILNLINFIPAKAETLPPEKSVIQCTLGKPAVTNKYYFAIDGKRYLIPTLGNNDIIASWYSKMPKIIKVSSALCNKIPLGAKTITYKPGTIVKSTVNKRLYLVAAPNELRQIKSTAVARVIFPAKKGQKKDSGWLGKLKTINKTHTNRYTAGAPVAKASDIDVALEASAYQTIDDFLGLNYGELIENNSNTTPNNSTGNTQSGSANSSNPNSTSNSTTSNSQVKVIINGAELSQTQIDEFKNKFGTPPAAGNYWYDAKSGAYGYNGYSMAGLLAPGLNYGTLSRNASNGHSGITVNGRELADDEVLFYLNIFGAVLPGDYWLDGNTGNYGIAGLEDVPLGNLLVAIKQAVESQSKKFPGSGSNSSFYGDSTTGGGGGCIYANFRDAGSGSYSGATVGCG